jgi:general secretion pathway protein B
VSFILDALRKSEHERQRSATPGLSQVPLATPEPQTPRWALAVMGVLVATVLVLGAAWWQSSRAPAEVAGAAPTVERSVELPPPAPRAVAPQQAAPTRLPQRESSSLSAAAASAAGGAETASTAAQSREPELALAPRVQALGNSGEAAPRADAVGESSAPALPSAAALVAEGVALPPLKLELHAFSTRPRDRFVFINGRKYVEGDRLPEGPQVLSIEPTGVVLAHAGRRFILVQE